MRWTVFVITALLLLVLEYGTSTLMSLPVLGAPAFLIVLAAFVGMHAPPRLVPWALCLLGVLCDLNAPRAIVDGPASVSIVGPMALGYLLAAFAVLQLRGMVYRDSVLATMLVIVLIGIPANLVGVAVLSARALPWTLGEVCVEWRATDELFSRFLQLLYSALLALPVGYLLIRTRKLWQFEQSTQ